MNQDVTECNSKLSNNQQEFTSQWPQELVWIIPDSSHTPRSTTYIHPFKILRKFSLGKHLYLLPALLILSVSLWKLSYRYISLSEYNRWPKIHHICFSNTKTWPQQRIFITHFKPLPFLLIFHFISNFVFPSHPEIYLP